MYPWSLVITVFAAEVTFEFSKSAQRKKANKDGSSSERWADASSVSLSSSNSTLCKKGEFQLCIASLILFHLLYSAVFPNPYPLYLSNFCPAWVFLLLLLLCSLICINIKLFIFSNFFYSLNFVPKGKCDYSALRSVWGASIWNQSIVRLFPYLIIPVPYCYAFTLLTVGYLSFQFQSLSFPCVFNFIPFLYPCLCIFCISAFCPTSWCISIYFGGSSVVGGFYDAKSLFTGWNLHAAYSKINQMLKAAPSFGRMIENHLIESVMIPVL